MDVAARIARTGRGHQIAKQQFNREDMANEYLLNEAIWQSVKGAASKMPAPQHHVILP